MRIELFRLVDKLEERGAIYEPNPHSGMILCKQHLVEAQGYGVEPMADVISDEEQEFWRHKCQMCGVTPNPDAICQSEDCGKALHPQWPAIYCTNRCAMNDL